MVNKYFAREPRILNVERTVSLINGVGKTGYPHANERGWIPVLDQSQKLT